jgi:hypothetical protein
MYCSFLQVEKPLDIFRLFSKSSSQKILIPNPAL